MILTPAQVNSLERIRIERSKPGTTLQVSNVNKRGGDNKVVRVDYTPTYGGHVRVLLHDNGIWDAS